ncbi:hypothetical protein SK128_000854, partial [Halocaridina rubra]
MKKYFAVDYNSPVPTVYDENDYDCKKRILENTLACLQASINAELGYGGARLLDVRFTGRECIDELTRCIHYCDGENLKLRIVGSSAGNIIVYILAFLMGVRGQCCGYDVNDRKRRLLITNKEAFFNMSGLHLPESVFCACDGVRAICDLFLEVAALQEHPAWHEPKRTASGTNYPGLVFNQQRLLPTKTIQEILYNERTMEQILEFSEGTAASGFSDLYVEAPV